MTRCTECDEPIDEARIKCFLDLDGALPTKCLKCAEKETNKKPIIGYMVMSGEKGARKVGGELMAITPINNPNYHEMVRQAKRANRRGR